MQIASRITNSATRNYVAAPISFNRIVVCTIVQNIIRAFESMQLLLTRQIFIAYYIGTRYKALFLSCDIYKIPKMGEFQHAIAESLRLHGTFATHNCWFWFLQHQRGLEEAIIGLASEARRANILRILWRRPKKPVRLPHVPYSSSRYTRGSRFLH